MLLNDLAQTLRNAGSWVEEAAGWIGHSHGQMDGVRTIVVHHTATPQSHPGDYPSWNVVRNGREGLAGPLAQLGVGRSGKVYVFSNGLAWHAGVVRNNNYGNNWSVGLEVESAGLGLAWPEAQVDATARACAALCKRYGLGSGQVLGHFEVCYPVGRKSDPVGIPGGMNAFRARVQHYLDAGFNEVVEEEEDDFMANVRIAKWSGSGDVYAVTPLGHWRFKSMQDADDYAYKWNLPRDGAGHVIVEVNNNVGWFGPRIDWIQNDALTGAQKATEAVNKLNEEFPNE